MVVPDENETPEGSEAVLKSDLLDDFLFNAANYIYLRRKFFISLAIAIVVIIVSTWGTFEYLAYRENLRNEELFKIEQIVYDNGLSDMQRYEKAEPLLDSFLQNHPGTDQHTIALFYRAALKSAQSAYEEAEEDLNSLLSILKPESDLYFLASLYLSNIYRDQGKDEEALEVLQTATSETINDIILMEQAEIYMNSDRQEKAKELLQILLQDYPKSLYANKARQLLEIL